MSAKPRNGAAILLALVLLLAVPGVLRADILVLKNGKKLEGQIISQSRFQIRIRTTEGDKTLAKSAVRRIIFGGGVPPEKEPVAEPAAGATMKSPETKPVDPPVAVTAPGPGATEASVNSPFNQPTANKGGVGPENSSDLLAALRRKAEEARRRAELERERREWRRLRREREEELSFRKARREKFRRDLDRSHGAFWRSLVLPGWGHYHIDKKRKAVLFGGSALGAAGSSFIALSAYNQAVTDYNAASNLAVLGANDTPLALAGYLSAQDAQTRARARGQQATFFLLTYLGIYLYNLYDIRADRPVAPSFAPLRPLPPEPTVGWPAPP